MTIELTEINSSEEAFIAGYGDGGFRMGNTRFEGSMMITPEGFYPWDVSDKAEISLNNLAPILDASGIEIIVIGLGPNMAFLAKDIRAALKEKKIALEAIDTGAAVTTYNVLLQEGRLAAAALIAI